MGIRRIVDPAPCILISFAKRPQFLVAIAMAPFQKIDSRGFGIVRSQQGNSIGRKPGMDQFVVKSEATLGWIQFWAEFEEVIFEIDVKQDSVVPIHDVTGTH